MNLRAPTPILRDARSITIVGAMPDIDIAGGEDYSEIYTSQIGPVLKADEFMGASSPPVGIGNVRRIRAVVLRGRFLDRTALDGLLRVAERAAAR